MKRLAIMLAFASLEALTELTGQHAAHAANEPLDHPHVVAIREIYQSVEKAIARSRLKKQSRNVETCGQAGENRIIFSDAQGVIRKYVLDSGSDDSELIFNYYYDPVGRLRFIFISGGAVNGTHIEQRIYFNERDALIRKDWVQKAGPGYTFHDFSGEKELLIRAARPSYEATACQGAHARKALYRK